MFGVVVCPKCNRARGIELSAKKSRCPRCGAIHDVSLLRLYFITDNQSELREAIRSEAILLNREDLRLPDFNIGENSSANISRARKQSKQDHLSKEDIDIVSMEIIKKHGSFTLDCFERVLIEQYPKEAERIMQRLRAEDKMRLEHEGELDFGLAEDLCPDGKLTSREEKVISILRALDGSQGSFTKEEIKQGLDIASKDEIEDLISKLMEKGIITETRTGVFKLVQ